MADFDEDVLDNLELVSAKINGGDAVEVRLTFLSNEALFTSVDDLDTPLLNIGLATATFEPYTEDGIQFGLNIVGEEGTAVVDCHSSDKYDFVKAHLESLRMERRNTNEDQMGMGGKEDDRVIPAVEKLAEEKKKVFLEMRHAVQAALPGNKCDDGDLLRMLVQKEFGLEASTSAFIDNENWRERIGAGHIKVREIAHIMRSGFLIPTKLKDKKGRGIVYGRPARWDKKSATAFELTKYACWLVEFMIHVRKADKVVLLINMDGASMSNVDARLPKIMMETLENRYPGRLSRVVFVNPPFMFRIVFPVVQRQLSSSAGFLSGRQKMLNLGKNSDLIRSFIDASNLPEELGGVTPVDAGDLLRDACEAEGRALCSFEALMAEHEQAVAEESSLLADSLREDSAADCMEGADYHGWMKKQGGIIRNWKKRLFIKRGKILYYYTDEKADKPQGSVMLDNSYCTMDDATRQKCGFLLVTPSRTWSYICDSDEAAKVWIQELAK